jgi:hypothetical protein
LDIFGIFAGIREKKKSLGPDLFQTQAILKQAILIQAQVLEN